MPLDQSPGQIYASAVTEGRRRLSMPPLEQVATGFIAGVTIVLGIIGLAVTRALVEPDAGAGIGKIAGALVFGIGLLFLVVGRAELFTENLFDPVAAAVEARRAPAWFALLRLWGVVLILNLIGGSIMVALITVDGALPEGSGTVLVETATEFADVGAGATFVRAVLAGVLITLLSYLVHGAGSVAGQMVLAFLVGFLLAVGPFDHVVVSALHLLAGVWLGDVVTYADVARNVVTATAGNLVGGLVLVTLTHIAQVKGARGES